MTLSLAQYLLWSANADTAAKVHQPDTLRIVSGWLSLAAMSAFADHNSTTSQDLDKHLQVSHLDGNDFP